MLDEGLVQAYVFYLNRRKTPSFSYGDIRHGNLRLGRVCKTYTICSTQRTKNPLPLGMGSVNRYLALMGLAILTVVVVVNKCA